MSSVFLLRDWTRFHSCSLPVLVFSRWSSRGLIHPRRRGGFTSQSCNITHLCQVRVSSYLFCSSRPISSLSHGFHQIRGQINQRGRLWRPSRLEVSESIFLCCQVILLGLSFFLNVFGIWLCVCVWVLFKCNEMSNLPWQVLSLVSSL